MGALDPGFDKEHFKFIKASLRRRGLKPDLDEEWEVHGPHPDMDYQVYVGWAYNEALDEYICVAIYPRAVYEIDDPDDWWKTDPENRIPVI